MEMTSLGRIYLGNFEVNQKIVFNIGGDLTPEELYQKYGTKIKNPFFNEQINRVMNEKPIYREGRIVDFFNRNNKGKLEIMVQVDFGAARTNIPYEIFKLRTEPV